MCRSFVDEAVSEKFSQILVDLRSGLAEIYDTDEDTIIIGPVDFGEENE